MFSGLMARLWPAKVPASVNGIVRVDRSLRPDLPRGSWMYPDCIKSLLQRGCREEFTLEEIRDNLWLHEGQKNGGRVRGEVIYDFLREPDMLEKHLGLVECLAIQQKGIAAFQNFFDGKTLYFWGGLFGQTKTMTTSLSRFSTGMAAR